MDPSIVSASAYRQMVKDGLKSIPVLSIALPVDDIFGPRGIYSKPARRGMKWEREASAEYFDPASGAEFQKAAGLRIQGKASRNPSSAPKHSLSLRFRDRVHRHFFNNGALTAKRTLDRFHKRMALINTAITVESARWGDYRRDVHSFSNGPYDLYTCNDHWIPEGNRLRNTYFPRRSEIVLNLYRDEGLYPSLTAPSFSKHGGTVNKGLQVSMTAPSGRIYYTLDGVDPRAPGGTLSRSAVAYGDAVTINTTAILKARVRSGLQWSDLNEALFIVESVMIHEFLASNKKGIRDNHGEREDWIELHNGGTGPVDIGGMYLTDSRLQPKKWRIPAPTIVQPGSTVLYWLDNQPQQGVQHATFKLSAGGEEIHLVDTTGSVFLDSIIFGPQQADISTGRLHDGPGHLVTCQVPSPNATNTIALCGGRGYSRLGPSTQTSDHGTVGHPASIRGRLNAE